MGNKKIFIFVTAQTIITERLMSNDHNIPEEFVQEIRATFDLFDQDNSGSIDREELGDVFKSLGQRYSDAELDEMIAENDNSGSIEFGEFLQLMRRRMRDTDTEEELVEAFKVFDRDSNGLITVQELRMVMKQIGENLSEKDCKEIIEAGDRDNDGCLNFDEFIRMMVDKNQQY